MMRVGIAAIDSAIGFGGGTDIYTRQLVAALAAYGPAHEYVVLTTSDSLVRWYEQEWPSHVQFATLRASEPLPSLDVRFVRRIRRTAGLTVPPQHGEAYLARQIDELSLDVVHFPRTTIYPLSLETPCVLTFFDLQHEYYPEFFTHAELAERRQRYRSSVETAHQVIVPSNYTRHSLVEKYNVAEDKMTMIPVGLTEGFGRASAAEVQRVKAKYALPNEFIYYPANPWQHKNHARLMAALRIYQEIHGTPPFLVLSGRLFNEKRDSTSLALAAGVENFVLDLDFVPPSDLPGLYTAAALMVFPSLFEGFGIPLIEAMACGCPIAAANATSIPECVERAALLFDPFDPSAIAAAIHRLLTENVLRESLTAAGYQRITLFEWRSIVPAIIDVYERVASAVQ